MQLTEAQRLIYNTAKTFAEREIRPHVRERANDESFPLDVMRQLADNGLLGGTFPEEYGGGGIDNVSFVLLCEAIGGACPSVFTAALTVQLSLVSTAIYKFGTEEQRQRWLPDLFAAKTIGAFALSEPNVGSDPAAMELTAVRNEGGWVLNGSKFWISNGSQADVILVFAQADPGTRHKGIAAFVVDGNSPGLERQPIADKLGLHASNTAALFFDGVHVSDDRLL
ncbi:MAG: acyl-CoA dehydrogenase family protein, partial [Dehalococcoidia bacterium]